MAGRGSGGQEDFWERVHCEEEEEEETASKQSTWEARLVRTHLSRPGRVLVLSSNLQRDTWPRGGGAHGLVIVSALL